MMAQGLWFYYNRTGLILYSIVRQGSVYPNRYTLAFRERASEEPLHSSVVALSRNAAAKRKMGGYVTRRLADQRAWFANSYN